MKRDSKKSFRKSLGGTLWKLVTFGKLVWLLTGRLGGVGIDSNRCNIFLKGGRQRNDGIST